MGKDRHHIKWNDVLAVYKKVFQEFMGREIRIQYIDDLKPVYEMMGNKYQVIYDRLYNRRFDNRKFLQAVGEHKFTTPENGLAQSLRKFLEEPKFRNASYSTLALMDRIAKERIRLSDIPGIGQKSKYIAKRYLPNKVIYSIKAAMKYI